MVETNRSVSVGTPSMPMSALMRFSTVNWPGTLEGGSETATLYVSASAVKQTLVTNSSIHTALGQNRTGSSLVVPPSVPLCVRHFLLLFLFRQKDATSSVRLLFVRPFPICCRSYSTFDLLQAESFGEYLVAVGQVVCEC